MKATHYTLGDDNVFADLGFSEKKAKQLKADADKRIKQDIKIQLMEEITRIIKAQEMTQADAAKRLSVSRPRVSDVMTGKATKFTIDALVVMLQRLGRKARLSVEFC